MAHFHSENFPNKIDKSGQYYIRIQVFTEENDHIFE
jgi:hypothetical protein